MKKFYSVISLTIFVLSLSAKTYIVSSGKWTDASAWNLEYPGTVISPEDEVIISGQVTMNTGIVVEGTLRVEKGASMVGMKDLVISKSGKFVNNGNTVMKKILNEGTIHNNLIMESMMDIDNKGVIGNNNNMVAGNNFSNIGGKADGKAGAYFVNNTVMNSASSEISKDTKVFYGSKVELSESDELDSPLRVMARMKEESVELSVYAGVGEDISFLTLERCTGGNTYTTLQTVPVKNNGEKKTIVLRDDQPGKNLNHYRITATNSLGMTKVLPLTSIHPGNHQELSFAGK